GPGADVGAWVEVPLEAGGAPRLLVAEHEERGVVVPEAPTADPGDLLIPDGPGGSFPALPFPPVQLALFDPDTGDVLARLEDERHRVRSVLGAHQGAVVFTWDHLGPAPDGSTTATTTATCG